MIPLDFVPGTHGHFVEYALNRSLGFFSQDLDLFTELGTSHCKPQAYLDSRKICCDHWFENARQTLGEVSNVIRIVFDPDDLLWITHLSLARAADLDLDIDQLHIQTRSKLCNVFYKDTLDAIDKAYPFLDPDDESIPRNVLREFFKFGFRDAKINGYWCKLQDMLSVPVKNQYQLKLKHIYDLQTFRQELYHIADWLQLPCDTGEYLEPLHTKFSSYLGDLNIKKQCDVIILSVVEQQHIDIPKLTLIQESYINARLEVLYKKEMPFHDIDYFTNTKDIIQYIKYQAPDI